MFLRFVWADNSPLFLINCNKTHVFPVYLFVKANLIFLKSNIVFSISMVQAAPCQIRWFQWVSISRRNACKASVFDRRFPILPHIRMEKKIPATASWTEWEDRSRVGLLSQTQRFLQDSKDQSVLFWQSREELHAIKIGELICGECSFCVSHIPVTNSHYLNVTSSFSTFLVRLSMIVTR